MAEVKLHDEHAPSLIGNAQVRVTNKNDFDLEDTFDSVPYTFPGAVYEKADIEKKSPIYKAVTVPPDVAAHIFAYGIYGELAPKQQLDAMFKHMAKRFGWNTAEREKEGRSREWFRKIDIRSVTFRLVEDQPEDEGARGVRGKTA